MLLPGKTFEFIEIGKSQIMVAEIRALQIPVVFQNHRYMTTKWMNFHVWQEVYLLLANITEEYKTSSKILKSTKIQTCEGKSVKMRYRFTPYQGISTDYLNDCMEEFTLFQATKKKGKRKTHFVPSSHSLIVSVCPKKSISYKYQIAFGVSQIERLSQCIIHELELKMKSEIGYLSDVISKSHVFSSSVPIYDTKISKKRNVATPDCKKESISSEESSNSILNHDEENSFLGFDEEDQSMFSINSRLSPISLFECDTPNNLFKNSNKEMAMVKENHESSSKLTISSPHPSKCQSSSPNYLTDLRQLTGLTIKESLKEKRATSKTKMKNITKEEILGNQKVLSKLKHSRKISKKSTDESNLLFDSSSASSSEAFKVQDTHFEKELPLSHSPMANNNRLNENLNITETQNPAMEMPQDPTTHMAETYNQNKDTTPQNQLQLRSFRLVETSTDWLQDDTKSIAISVNSLDDFIKNLTDANESKIPIQENKKGSNFQIKDSQSNLITPTATLTSNSDFLQKEDSKISDNSSNLLIRSALSQNTGEMLIKTGAVFIRVSLGYATPKCDKFSVIDDDKNVEMCANSSEFVTPFSGNISGIGEKALKLSPTTGNTDSKIKVDREAKMSNLDSNGSLLNLKTLSFTTELSNEDFEKSTNSSNRLLESMTSENTSQLQSQTEDETKMDDSLGISVSLSNLISQATGSLSDENLVSGKKNESSEMFVSNLDDLSQNNSGFDHTLPDIVIPLSTNKVLDKKKNLVHYASERDEKVSPHEYHLLDHSINKTKSSNSNCAKKICTRSCSRILQFSCPLKNDQFAHSCEITNSLSPGENTSLLNSTMHEPEKTSSLQDDGKQQESTAHLPISTPGSVVQNKSLPNVHKRKKLCIKHYFHGLSKDISKNQRASKNSKYNLLEKIPNDNTQDKNKSTEKLSNNDSIQDKNKSIEKLSNNSLPDLMLYSTSPLSDKPFPSQSLTKCTKQKGLQDKNILSEVESPPKEKKELKTSQNDQKIPSSCEKKKLEERGHYTRSFMKLFNDTSSHLKDVQSTYSTKQISPSPVKKPCSQNENSKTVAKSICSEKEELQDPVKYVAKSSTKLDKKEKCQYTPKPKRYLSRIIDSNIKRTFKDNENDGISTNYQKNRNTSKLKSEFKNESKEDDLLFTHDNFPLSSTPVSLKQPLINKYFSQKEKVEGSPAKRSFLGGKPVVKVKRRNEVKNILINSSGSSFETSHFLSVAASRKAKKKRSNSSSVVCSKKEKKSKVKANNRAGETELPLPLPLRYFTKKKKSVPTSPRRETLQSSCNGNDFKKSKKRNGASSRSANKLTKDTSSGNSLGKQSKSLKRKEVDNLALQDIPDLPDLRVPCSSDKKFLLQEGYRQKSKIKQVKCLQSNQKRCSSQKMKSAKKIKKSRVKKSINTSDLHESLPETLSTTSFDLNQESEPMEDSSNFESLSRLLCPLKANYEGAFLQTVKEELKRLTHEELKVHIRQNLPHFKNVVKENIFNARNQKLRMGPNMAFWFSSQKFYCLFDNCDFLIDLVSEEVKSLITQVDQHLSVRVYTAEVIIPELLKKILLSFSFVREKGISTDEDCEKVFDSLMAYQDQPSDGH